jgi:hypothetical protein
MLDVSGHLILRVSGVVYSSWRDALYVRAAIGPESFPAFETWELLMGGIAGLLSGFLAGSIARRLGVSSISPRQLLPAWTARREVRWAATTLGIFFVVVLFSTVWSTVLPTMPV